jgi:hypothetical protein
MTDQSPTAGRGRTAAAALLAGAAVAVVLGVYAHAHQPSFRPLFLFGFSGMLQLKTWLATAVAVLVVVQVLSALWMWGRLPGAGRAPGWIGPIHRWSGSIAFVVSLPVALHCVWSLGYDTTSFRVLAHSTVGCAFYGAYAAKMLGLRLKDRPAWFLPVLGGTVFTLFVLVWLTSAAWFFSRSGVPLV